MPLSIAEQMIARRKKAHKVIVTCYGERKEFATASKAINFFTLAVNYAPPKGGELVMLPMLPWQAYSTIGWLTCTLPYRLVLSNE